MSHLASLPTQSRSGLFRLGYSRFYLEKFGIICTEMGQPAVELCTTDSKPWTPLLLLSTLVHITKWGCYGRPSRRCCKNGSEKYPLLFLCLDMGILEYRQVGWMQSKLIPVTSLLFRCPEMASRRTGSVVTLVGLADPRCCFLQREMLFATQRGWWG